MKSAIIAIFSIISINSFAQDIWKYFTPADFAARRAKVMDKIGDGIAILQGAGLPEAFVSFRQDNNFYYLSGVEIPDATMLLDGKSKKAYLFVPDNISGDIKEEALIKAGTESAKKYMFDRVAPKTHLSGYLSYYTSAADHVWVITTPEETAEMSRDRCEMERQTRMNDPWDGRISKENNFINKIKERFPVVSIKNLSPVLDEMRWVKDAKEIAVMRECGRIGCLGFDEAMRVTKPGIYEYQVVAACDFIYANSNTTPAYFPIAASGPRGLSWHYNANNHPMEVGTVILLDYAPELNYYTTDITRTWPVSGQFTDDQLKMYNCVKQARDEVIAAMKPGVTVEDLEKIGKAVYARNGYEKNWPNYIGHFVGMAVHDVGPYDKPFVAGVVFNVEPILEDKEKKIHFRIEDTIVITATGAENLTPQSPVDAAAIYKLIKEKGVGEK
ncbi:Xaa-Pro peptidase family protein [Pollutibacter soli]|uniref:Xaa-Pro peptidase family protein n=1 Tax=Pollutibacter soli TaxID=3034157 RepID=UPI003013C0F4